MLIKYLAWTTNPCNFRNMGVNSHIMEKALENTNNSQVLLYLTGLKLMKTHVIQNVWECMNSHNIRIFCGKPNHSQGDGFWRN